MLFEWIKIIHVVSSILLLGVPLASAFYLFRAHRQQDLLILQQAWNTQLWLHGFFVVAAGIVQLISGFTLVFLKGYHLSEPWGVGSLTGFFIATLCWLPMIFLQIKCREQVGQAVTTSVILPKSYYRQMIISYLLGLVAVVCLVAVYYLMVLQSLV